MVITAAHRAWIYPDTLAFPERLQDPRLKNDLPPAIYAEVQDSFKNFRALPYFGRTDRELELVRMLRGLYGRAEVEHVLSGPGLVNLHRFTHRGGECPVVDDLDSPEAPARISQSALGGRCQFCAEAQPLSTTKRSGPSPGRYWTFSRSSSICRTGTPSCWWTGWSNTRSVSGSSA